MAAAALILLGALLILFATGCSDNEQAAEETAAATTESGSIVIEGLVDYPMKLTILDMDYMDWVTIEAEHPDLGVTRYEGVRLTEICSYVGVQAEAKTLTIASSDGYSADVALEDLSGKEAMLAVAEDGALNTVMPGLGAETWVADVVAMEFK